MSVECLNAPRGRNALHFANVQWGMNYVHLRGQDYRVDMYERYGIDEPNELLDYVRGDGRIGFGDGKRIRLSFKLEKPYGVTPV